MHRQSEGGHLGRKRSPVDSADPWQKSASNALWIASFFLFPVLPPPPPSMVITSALGCFHYNSCSFSHLSSFLSALYPVHPLLPTQNSVPIMSLPGSKTDCISSPPLLSLQPLPLSVGLFSLPYKYVPILPHVKQNKKQPTTNVKPSLDTSFNSSYHHCFFFFLRNF